MLIFPDLAIKPSLSKDLSDFNLIHLSIKQFPGPMSSEPDSANLLAIDLLLIEVIFAIPPIFNIVTGVFILFCSYFEYYKMYNFNDLQVFYFD